MGGKSPARTRANYQLTEFILNIPGMNYWIESPMGKILVFMVTFPKQPKVSSIFKLCSILLSASYSINLKRKSRVSDQRNFSKDPQIDAESLITGFWFWNYSYLGT